MPADTIAEWSGEAMGTRVHLVVDESACDLLADAVARVRDWEVRWSRFRPDSDVGTINAARGRPVVVPADTAGLIALALDGWNVTAGRFDPSMHDALVNAGYGRPFADGPTPSGPAPARPDPATIAVEPDTGLVSMPADVRIDLGGVAKGHAADLLVAHLLDHGATGAAATLGGDTAVGGSCPYADAWPVADDVSGEAIAHLHHGGFCYSSTRARRWETATGPAHHIIDPSTGRPAQTSLDIAAIAASSAATAEVFATAAIVAGWPDAADLIEGAGLSGFVVTAAGERHDLGQLAQNPPETAVPADGRRRE